MGYKIPDLKEDIKKDIRNYIDDNGYKDWHYSSHDERIAEINDIVDKHFEKIERWDLKRLILQGMNGLQMKKARRHSMQSKRVYHALNVSVKIAVALKIHQEEG